MANIYHLSSFSGFFLHIFLTILLFLHYSRPFFTSFGSMTSPSASPSSHFAMGYDPLSSPSNEGEVEQPPLNLGVLIHHFLSLFHSLCPPRASRTPIISTHFWREPFSTGPFHLHCVFPLFNHFHQSFSTLYHYPPTDVSFYHFSAF